MNVQFRLRTLLLVFVYAWSAMAAFGPLGIIVAVAFAFYGTLMRIAVVKWRKFRGGERYLVFIELFLAVLIGIMMLGLLMPALNSGSHRSCYRNLRHLANGLRTYHEAHGCFPPAYVADEDGKPMHSWRVLILPYLEQEKLHDAYDFSQPWNSPANRKLLAQIPREFQCPKGPHRQGITEYVVVTGPQTVFPGANSTRLEHFAEEASDTILLVEVPDSDIEWTEPRDVTLEELLARRVEKSRHYRQTGHFLRTEWDAQFAAMADGHIVWIRVPTPENLAPFVNIRDGEKVYLEDIRAPRPWKSIDWGHCTGLAVFVVSLILLLRRPLPPQWIEPPQGDPDERSQ